MQNISRRTALLGTAAAVAATGATVIPSAALTASTTDPHVAWLEECRAAFFKASELFRKSGELEADLRKTTDVYEPTEMQDPFRGKIVCVHSVNQVEAMRDQVLLSIWIGTPEMTASKKAAKKAYYNSVAAEFSRKESSRAELEASTGIAELERRAFAWLDRERELDFLIADTPATTLEGVHAQSIILHKWVTDGQPRRDPENVDLGTDERERIAIASRITSTLATLTGNDAATGFSKFEPLS